MSGQLIGLGGLLRSGKDAFSDRLVSDHGWEKMGMSDPLNNALLALNPLIPVRDDERTNPGIDGEWHIFYALIEDNVPREPRNPTNIFYARYQDIFNVVGYVEAKKIPEVRRLLMVLGTEVGRNMIGEDAWVDIAARDIQAKLDAGVSVAITGIRYPNELKMIEDLGGTTLWISRAGLEDPVSTHSSENSVSLNDFDVVIDNNGTLDDLHLMADRVASGLLLG